MSKKKILIISYSHLNSDPRLRRQIKALSEKFDLFTAGLSPVDFGDFPFHKLDSYDLPEWKHTEFHYNKPFFIRKPVSLYVLLRTRLWRIKTKLEPHMHKFPLPPKMRMWRNYWDSTKKKFLKDMTGIHFDAVLANDMIAVPVAKKIASLSNAKLIFDAHEYSPGENDTNEYWVKNIKPLITEICKTDLYDIDLMFNVCQGIAEEYEKNFGVRSIVVTNAADYSDLQPTPSVPGKIRMIHHGAAVAERCIDQMIKLVDLLDERFTLDLMLVQSPGSSYYEELLEMIKSRPRVRMLPPVKTKEIAEKINPYDVGLYMLPPTNLNNHFTLPNKFFEFIQGRLAVAIGPSPEMKRIVEQYGLGLVSKNFDLSEMARELNKLTLEDVQRFKKNADVAARELNSAANARVLVDSISKTLGIA